MGKEKTQAEVEKKSQDLEQPKYNEEEITYRGFLIQRLYNASESRAEKYTEFDDMTYTRNYEENAKAANAYLRPKKNEEDTRIVTGTTKEKVGTLVSALLNYNLEPNIVAYDDNDLEVEELGESMEKLVEKSRKIEEYDDKRPLIYKELVDQGTCFVEEVYIEKQCVEKKIKDIDWSEGVDPSKIKWDKKMKKVYGTCEAKLLVGTKVFLGNIREFDIRQQPYMFVAEIVPYENAKTIFGKWERWKYVPRNLKEVYESVDSGETDYYNWTSRELEKNMVEVIRYYDKNANEMMIMCNGVMMLPAGFPLTAVSPSGEYPVAKGDIDPFQFFAYSKSFPNKTKVDQQVLDEVLRNLILKLQQSFSPPMANNSNRVLSRRIFFPGTITRGVNTDKVKPLLDSIGVTNSDFQMFQLIKEGINEKTVSPVFSGDTLPSRTTATQVLETKKQQMMKLGMTIWGVISLERQLAWLRIYNILANWTKPVDKRVDKLKSELKDVYRTVTIDSKFDDGVPGRTIIDFDPAGTELDSYQIEAENKMLSRPGGKKVRKYYLNGKELRQLKTKWYVTVQPTEKETSELKQVMFSQKIQDAYNLFGPQSVNQEYAKQRFALVSGEDPEKFFNQAPQQQMQQGVPGMEEAAMAEGEIGGTIGKELKEGARQGGREDLGGLVKQSL